MHRLAARFLRLLAGAAIVFAAISCSPSPPKDEPEIAWPAVDTVGAGRSPMSAALVCPGARSATAWLPGGAFWNGDVELAVYRDQRNDRQIMPIRIAGIGVPTLFWGWTPGVFESGIPIYRRESDEGMLAYAFSPWREDAADTSGWAWIGLELRAPADSARTFSFAVAVRSGGEEGHYIDPRAAHADSFAYTRDGNRILRDGRLVAIVDPRAHPEEPAPGRPIDGERVLYDRYAARLIYEIEVPSGARTLVRFALAPLGGVEPNATPPGWNEPFARAIERTAERWRAELAKGARYSFPDAQWQRVFTASKGLLVTDYERHGEQRSPLGNPLQYRDFYLRDGARVVRALDLLGRHDLAIEGLSLLYQFQWPPGAFVSQRGQLDGTGQALWALQQHVALTNDEETLRRHGDAALKGATWVVNMRNATRQIGGPAAGLLPYSDPRDNEFLRGHLLGTDAWGVLALDAAADLSARMGQDAARWAAEAQAYRRDLVAVWDRETRRQGRPLPPAIERGARDWGNLSAAYPTAVLDPGDARVRALDAWLRANHYTEGLMTFASRDSIHHYVSFDLTQARLRRGDRAGTLEDVKAYLDHTLPDGTGWEFRHRNGAGYGDNLPPHGTFAAMWIDLARSCVLYEDGSRGLVLLAGVPERWFDPSSAGLVVEGAPTSFGAASLSTRAAEGGALELALDLPAAGRVMLPAGYTATAVGDARGGHLEGSVLSVGEGKSTWRVSRAAAR
jgi:hypothetical protein